MIHLAFTHGEGRQARMFRDAKDALEWLLTPEEEGGPGGSGGEIVPFDRIDLAEGFRLIHNYSNIPGNLEYIR